MENEIKIGRFSTPLEDYSRALKKIRTVADVREVQRKYEPFLDDAEPAFLSIDDSNFAFFKKHLHLCWKDSNVLPPDQWLEEFGAIPLPKLFIEIAPFLSCGMGSGFVMNRLLDEKLAVIEGGRFKLRIPKDN